jgi:hypothetical protein
MSRPRNPKNLAKSNDSGLGKTLGENKWGLKMATGYLLAILVPSLQVALGLAVVAV